MDWEKCKYLLGLEQVRGVIRTSQTFTMKLCGKIISNFNSKTLSGLVKRSTLDS